MNSQIQDKILSLLRSQPKNVIVIKVTDDNTNLTYNELDDIWYYYRLTDENYYDNNDSITQTISDDDMNDIKNIYEKYPELKDIFTTHVLNSVENIILFYSPLDNHFYCKFKSINEIDQSIFDKYKENINELTSNSFQSKISFYWTIKLVVENLQEDFNELYDKADLNKNDILAVSF